MYNQYNIKAKSSSNYLTSILSNFKNYLISEKISGGSIRSYLSDVRHFLGWLEFFLQANKILDFEDRQSKVEVRSRNLNLEDRNENAKNPISNFYSQDQASNFNSLPSISSLLKHINEKVMAAYKNYLTDNNVPLKTVNRRFSSLRKFGSFCQAQNWVTASPFDTLRNISSNQPFPESEYHLGEFKTELWKKGLAKVSLKNYMADIKQFLAWHGGKQK